jgi:hypothetical protein
MAVDFMNALPQLFRGNSLQQRMALRGAFELTQETFNQAVGVSFNKLDQYAREHTASSAQESSLCWILLPPQISDKAHTL